MTRSSLTASLSMLFASLFLITLTPTEAARRPDPRAPVYTMADVKNPAPADQLTALDVMPTAPPLDSPAYQTYRTERFDATVRGRMFVTLKGGEFATCYDQSHPDIPTVFALPWKPYSRYLLARFVYDIMQTGRYPGTLGKTSNGPWWLSDSGYDRGRGSLVQATTCAPDGSYEFHLGHGPWTFYALIPAHRLPPMVVKNAIYGSSTDGEQFMINTPSTFYDMGYSDEFFETSSPLEVGGPGSIETAKDPVVYAHFGDR